MDETGAILAVLGDATVALGVWGLGTVRGRWGLSVHGFRAPAVRPTEVVPYHSARGRPGRAVLQLAWIEGRRTALHPAFLSLGSLWALALLPFFFSSSDAGWTLGGLAWMLALGGMIAANFGALRSRRESTEELFSSLPVIAPARTSAHAVAAWVPAASTGALLFLLALRPGLEFGKGTPAFASVDLLQLPVLVGTLCVLGVALARWIPSSLVAPVVAVGFFALLGQVSQGESPSDVTWFWPTLSVDPRFASLSPVVVRWHIAYLVGLAVVLASLAVLRSGGRWRTALSLGAGAALAVGAGTLQVVAR